jgi:hypothetical protein
MLIRFKELPPDVQAVARTYGFSGLEAELKPCAQFKCPTNWCDYNIIRLVGYNQENGQHAVQTSGHYESFMNWTKEEQAMYAGKIECPISSPKHWFLVIDSYPKHCTVYCHPDAVNAKLLTGSGPELTKRELICLYLSAHWKASYRKDEARKFGFTIGEWNTCIAVLHGHGLLTVAGSVTTAGKNRARNLEFNSWEEVKLSWYQER